mmetsp:Transcript_24398/g.67830  ORF Transcript_24398/g.67830 Transcript_24398/m.67830 type:complete len:210 (-) Transcript_24398:208-837(-)|eukprot:CAMPEP_0117557014 /NCGR_PEP_ID=MMETSP0784-20121206/52108_1 /TAXON_ID=39447 /ORGANISM="" /LENGTH=209 /DNA_ID=CAMNT_0005354311 /DNA_START=30 /DNA_END=659 /DNA_ORIENTATION=-
MSDAHDALYERLQALAPTCGSCLEPLLRGFSEDSAFRAHLQEWVAARAPAFLAVCEDGSHPIAWTAYHNEYRELFGAKLRAILADLGITEQDLADFCAWLKSEGGSELLQDGGLHAFLEAVTASEEYENFLTVMFAEVGRQAGDQVDVTVPDGLGPGCPFAVTYLGTRYDVLVPEGCGPGSVVRITVTRPAASIFGAMFNLPDSFYGLD